MPDKNELARTIHFFTKGNADTASSRQRAYNIAIKLTACGLNCIVHEPFIKRLNKTKWPKKAGVIKELHTCFKQIKKDDIIYLQRTVYSNYFIIILAVHRWLFKRKFVFDFDDAIFFHLPRQMKWLTKNASQVFAGSHLLQEWAQQYNKHVHLIPTAIDFTLYADYSITYKQKEQVTIGWIGHGPHHYENLELLVPVLQACAAKKLNIKLLLIGSLHSKKVEALFNNIQGSTAAFVDALDWSQPNAIPQAIQAFDIGIMPLKNTNWNMGKCAFKAIEYMALGIPVVVSAVGENNYLVQDGVNGFTATDATEWAAKLEQLILSNELRKTLGRCGQETIKTQYAYHVIVPELYNILQSI